MSKFNWAVVVVIIIAYSVMVVINRNAHSDLRPFLGKWNGSFVAQRVGNSTDPRVLADNELKGFVVLYGANEKFDLEVSGLQEDVTVTGKWKILKPKRVELRPSLVKIDDHGGAEKRDPNMPFIPTAAVTAAYGKPFVLDLTAKGQQLRGLLVNIGDVYGSHVFNREGSGH